MARARGIPEVQHYVFDHEAPAEWTGPVERRDPATYQRASVHLTWRCRARFCGHWTAPLSYAPDRCNHCFTPRS